MNLDPDVVALLGASAASQKPPLHTLDVITARETYALTCKAQGLPLRNGIAVKDVSMQATDGASLGLRIYRSDATAHAVTPGLVFFHGGGWVVGSLDTHDPVCRALADEIGCIVVAVDYRLAPEYPSPTAAQDAVDAFHWVADHVGELGIDPTRVGVAGDSAGGFLATYVAQCLLESHERIRPAVQLLFYPVTDLTTESAGYSRVTTGLAFTASTMRWFRDLYVAPAEHSSRAQLAPLHQSSLSELPPTFLVVAKNDPLYEEGLAYAGRLEDAGVRVSLYLLLDQIHGFLTLGGAINAAADVIRLSGSFARRELSRRR